MPTLRWHQLSEVETYTVSLIGEDLQERPEVQTSSVEITWPEDWPPLESGASYVLVVKAGERASNDGNQSNVGLGFWLLDEQEIERVGGVETALQAQNVGFPGEDLLLAELLIKYQLRAEASSVLERAISAQPSAALWLTYGKVLLETGLVHEALESFDQGLQASQAAGLADFEAESLIGLGLVYRQMGDQEGSQANFQQAVEVFQQIGDQGRLAEVSELMDKR
jgi:tetratricopeptide (TPR) repeat protein